VSTPPADILRDLGDGLILRRAERADALALATMNAIVHSDQGMHPLIYDLLDSPHDHPYYGARDFTVVEDTRTGEIVSSLCSVPQRWWYEDVELVVGQPEFVGTLPGYRRRGLVRAQFNIIHEWGRQRGEHLQAILGIPWYYRQFGYEMALQAEGGRLVPVASISPLEEGQAEPFRLRPATETDLPFVAATYNENRRRWLLSADRDLAIWRYDLLHRRREMWTSWEIRLVEAADRRPVGFVMPADHVRRGLLAVAALELQAGTSWLAVAPSILRHLRAVGERLAGERVDQRCEGIFLGLGDEHPLYQVAACQTSGRDPYAWYLRLPDVAGFLSHIRPVLERRLAQSVAVGHTGELKITFYRSGVRLVFADGRLDKVEPWQPEPGEEGDAAFPGLTFTQLVMGYRSLAELRASFPDCWQHRPAPRLLLEALFPKQPSAILQVQ